jgi:hypothetical protein
MGGAQTQKRGMPNEKNKTTPTENKRIHVSKLPKRLRNLI